MALQFKFSSSLMALCALSLLQSISTLRPQESHERHHETDATFMYSNSPSTNAQPPAFSHKQRSTQLVASKTGQSLIMPANNEIQVNNFQQRSQLLAHNQGSPLRYAKSERLDSKAHPRSQPTTRTVHDDSRDQSLNQLNHHRHTQSHQHYQHPAEQVNAFALPSNLELALRQTSGDESVFAPLPSLEVPGHSVEWAQQPNLSSPSEQPAGTTTATTTTTTEQSNNISPSDSLHSSFLPKTPANQKEYQSLLQNATTLDFNNQVFDDNINQQQPTAPSSSGYYFSSMAKLPDSERASNAWWALGFGQEYDRASNLTRNNYLDYCDKSELLIGNKQRSLCRLHPKIIPIVARGLKMAIDECQTRFSTNRWNCSLALDDSLSADAKSKSQLFGDVMKNANRERSFLNAIVAAGLAHAMTKACSQNELPEECSCDKRIRSRTNKGKVEWVACSDDIDYGSKFSRDFSDNVENDSDAASMINMHNNEVGRRVFKSTTDITCTCQNGENGFCQTKRCWKHLGLFSDIGDELMKRYESATHVQPSNRDPHKLRPVRRGVRKPKRKDLVFIDESPDYCMPDTRLGVLGTQNRVCNSTSLGADSCSLLCCGRGYQVVVEENEEDCNCKFVWCCHVKCDRCKRHVPIDVCN